MQRLQLLATKIGLAYRDPGAMPTSRLVFDIENDLTPDGGGNYAISSYFHGFDSGKPTIYVRAGTQGT